MLNFNIIEWLRQFERMQTLSSATSPGSASIYLGKSKSSKAYARAVKKRQRRRAFYRSLRNK